MWLNYVFALFFSDKTYKTNILKEITQVSQQKQKQMQVVVLVLYNTLIAMMDTECTEDEQDENGNNLPQTVVIDDGEEEIEHGLDVLSGNSNNSNREMAGTMVMNDSVSDDEDIDLNHVNNNNECKRELEVKDNIMEDTLDEYDNNNGEEVVEDTNISFQSEKIVKNMNDTLDDINDENNNDTIVPTLTMKIDSDDIDLNDTNETENSNKQQGDDNDSHLIATMENGNEFPATMVIDDDENDLVNTLVEENDTNKQEEEDSDGGLVATMQNESENDNEFPATMVIEDSVEENEIIEPMKSSNNSLENNNEFPATMTIDDSVVEENGDRTNQQEQESLEVGGILSAENDKNDSVDLVNTISEQIISNDEFVTTMIIDDSMDINNNTNNKQ